MKLKLIRVETGKEGTFGILKIENKLFCLTLEPNDLGNKRFQSCIPEGKYKCEYQLLEHGKERFQVLNVPGRDGIFFHCGNTVEETKGCILLGSEIFYAPHKILRSRYTFETFKRVVGRNFDLQIVSSYL